MSNHADVSLTFENTHGDSCVFFHCVLQSRSPQIHVYFVSFVLRKDVQLSSA